MNNQTIYLDSHATTRVDQEVLNSMLPFFMEHYGNGNHAAGRKTNAALEAARFQVSTMIGARPSEVVFTSGATESINLAIRGLARANRQERRHIVTQRTEHSATLRCIESLERIGYRVSMLEVDAVGRIDLNELFQVVGKDTLLVAIMLVNNEIGTTQPIKEIGKICRNRGASFFCDLTQGLGWHPIDVDEMNIDLAAMSSHKIYGPRGVGALFIRRKQRKVYLDPLQYGGGQERGLRPGTVNIPGIVGFGKAVELQLLNASTNTEKIQTLRDRLQRHLFSSIKGIKLNGCPINRHPGNLNIALQDVRGEELQGMLPNLIFSTGSACTSGSAKPSHVISSLGIEEGLVKNVFRLGIGKFNTAEEIDFAGAEIVRAVNQLRIRNQMKVNQFAV